MVIVSLAISTYLAISAIQPLAIHKPVEASIGIYTSASALVSKEISADLSTFYTRISIAIANYRESDERVTATLICGDAKHTKTYIIPPQQIATEVVYLGELVDRCILRIYEHRGATYLVPAAEIIRII